MVVVGATVVAVIDSDVVDPGIAVVTGGAVVVVSTTVEGEVTAATAVVAGGRAAFFVFVSLVVADSAHAARPRSAVSTSPVAKRLMWVPSI
jgi:hypothetical protein